ncbi:MAG: HDOD domain-containing protein [Clostridiales bacterium]|nr:HDOD domain-containing protein [Clostridiales bacterium]
MNHCIARQPIFTKDKKVYAYELLYREQGTEVYMSDDGDKATLDVMINSFLSVGLDTLTGNKKAFINFTERLITEEIVTLFSKDHVVVELLETVAPTKEIIEACDTLKALGYSLVLDDFILRENYDPLVDMADIIKLDFLNTTLEENTKIIQRCSKKGVKFLAEKIETIEDFNNAIELGCIYFQGYFFAKPEILPSKTIPPYRMNYFRLLNEINSIEPDFDKLAEIIEHDVAFSYEVLKIVNSAAFYRKTKISSVKQALVFMGINDIRKWIYMAMMRTVGSNKPNEIINYSMIRLKFMENLSIKLGQGYRSSQYITVGMLSMIDALMDMNMEDILDAINLADEIRDILLGIKKDGQMALSYQLVLEYEKANMDAITELSGELQLEVNDVSQMYYDSLEWLKIVSSYQ